MKGVILVNVGTPRAPQPWAVARYLSNFLMDKWILPIPYILRWLLVHGLIIPLRLRQSTQAYRQIWTESGSPLLSGQLLLSKALQAELGEDYQVQVGMQYGKPNLRSCLDEVVDEWIIVPLYPQQAIALQNSVSDTVFRGLQRQAFIPPLLILKSFYGDPEFVTLYANYIRQQLQHTEYEFLLMSYHGLPKRGLHRERQLPLCVEACSIRHSSHCYRAQCFHTSALLADGLGLSPERYATSFQSRLNNAWIHPFTDHYLQVLRQQGIQRLAVVSPSFVIDCLETLEEIGLRLRAKWFALGGTDFYLIPALNDHVPFVQWLGKRVRRA